MTGTPQLKATIVGREWLAMLLLLLGIPALAVAQCPPGGASQDTFVEPSFRDCTGTAAWTGTTAGGALYGGAATAVAADFDGDGVTGALEDTDMDSVYSTIGTALACTLAGGTVHVLVPGVYRESLTVTQSVVIRGLEGLGVVLDGSSPPGATGFCNAAPLGLIGIAATSGDVVIQNLAVRGFGTAGVSAGANAAVRIVNCRIQENAGTGVNGAVEIVGTEVLRNVFGVVSDRPLSMVNCVVANNLQAGVSWAGAATSCLVTGSRFVNNGSGGGSPFQTSGLVALTTKGSIAIMDSAFDGNVGHGVVAQGQEFRLSVSDSDMSHNVLDGVHAQATGTDIGHFSFVALQDSRMSANGSDGFEGAASNAFPPTAVLNASVSRDVFSSNGQYGVNSSTNAVVVKCIPGYNQLSFNVVANEFPVAPPNCNGAGAQNQWN